LGYRTDPAVYGGIWHPKFLVRLPDFWVFNIPVQSQRNHFSDGMVHRIRADRDHGIVDYPDGAASPQKPPFTLVIMDQHCHRSGHITVALSATWEACWVGAIAFGTTGFYDRDSSAVQFYCRRDEAAFLCEGVYMNLIIHGSPKTGKKQ
jgi:hypothetical protein